MKVLFVRPPRYMWPFNSESSSFWQPLGFASMAAVLRENDIDVEILDCLALKMGWKTLEKFLCAKSFDILCVGEEVCSIYQGLQLIKLVKKIKPQTIIITGGYYFTHVIDESLNKYPVDFIVRFEGEITLLELIKELEKPKRKQDFNKIKGIAYKNDGKIVITDFRKPIEDLDSLPIPAYDLLPMGEYGKNSKNHPKLVSIEHSRGCIDSCEFCTLWRQMPKLINGKYTNCYREKSADRCFEEVELLVKKYKRKTFGWVDGTWNSNSKWNNDFSDLILDSKLDIWHTAWMRADCIIRDEQKGILKKQVDSGLVQAMVGMERTTDNDMKKLNKKNNSFSTFKKSMFILKKYPSVFRLSTIIYGIEDETRLSFLKLYLSTLRNDANFEFFIPFTPLPGTKEWDYYNKNSMLKKDLRYFNFFLPVADTNTLSMTQMERLIKIVTATYTLRFDKWFFGSFFASTKRKRNIYQSFSKTILSSVFRNVGYKLLNKDYNLAYGKIPEWYDD